MSVMKINDVKNTVIPILKKRKVRRASLFGSLVRSQDTKKSDIDILVELPDESTLFDFLAVKDDLEDQLKRRVDLVEYEAIKPQLKHKILSEQLPIYSS